MPGTIVLFAGCANSSTPGSDRSQSPNSATSEAEEVSESPSPAASEAKEVSEPPNSAASKAEKVLVSVGYTKDELLSKYDAFAEFIELEDESSQKIIFTTNIAVKDFRFIEVGYKDKDTNVTFFENKVLYSLKELSPAKPFAVTWMERGTIPHRGISFIDETDTTRYFYMAMSGEDGSLLLVEFKNE